MNSRSPTKETWAGRGWSAESQPYVFWRPAVRLSLFNSKKKKIVFIYYYYLSESQTVTKWLIQKELSPRWFRASLGNEMMKLPKLGVCWGVRG